MRQLRPFLRIRFIPSCRSKKNATHPNTPPLVIKIKFPQYVEHYLNQHINHKIRNKSVFYTFFLFGYFVGIIAGCSIIEIFTNKNI